MAVKQKVLLIDTGNAEKSVKSLKQELKSLKDTLVNLEQGTQEYNQVLLQAANIQHELSDMNKELAASAMDFGLIMGNTTATIGGAVAGFQALTASMSLLGIENEDTLETIKKLQALMALSQGIAGVENGIKAFRRLTTAITNSTAVTKLFNKAQLTTAATETATSTATKSLQGAMVGEAAATGTATVATHAFKKALISTGIGAIVVAVGMLIAHLEDLAKWLGIGGDTAEQMAKQTMAMKQAYEYTNSTIQQTNTHLEGLLFQHEQEIKAMDLQIEKMKQAGKSEDEINVQRQKNLERMKELAQEEVDMLDKEQKSIEDKYLALMKSIAGATYSTTLSMQNMYNELAEAQHLVIMNEQELARMEADGSKASKKDIEAQKQRIEQAKQRVNLVNSYINTQKSEIAINDKINNEETKLHSDRKKRIKDRSNDLKKLQEEYAKFNNQLLIDTKTEKDKELETIKQAEDEKLKKLKEYQSKGVISTAKYNEQRNVIIEMYAKKRAEIEFKYEEQASLKREEILKKQYDLEKQEAERKQKLSEAQLEQEHINNLNALNKREISIVDYYNREKLLISKNYDEQRKLLEEDFKKLSNLISEQINERYELLSQNGISDKQKSKLTAEVTELSQQLLNLETDHNVALQDLAIETTNAIAETTRDIIDSEIENLHSMVDNVVGSMDAIAACGDGISTAWAGAFETLGNGLIDLTEKIKAGGAQWQDYGQLAVAGLLAASQVMNGLASQLDAQTKEGFEKQKKYQIAAATMSMLAGVTAALSGLFTTKSGPWDIALAAIQAGIITATGIAQIVKIKQQKFEGGGSSASASPSTSAMGSVVAPVQYTQDVQGAEIEGAIKDNRVYVVESDITNTQNKVDVAESEARY